MKKDYLILGLVIMLFASCSTDEQASTGTSGNQVTLSASITNSSTRVVESVDNTNGLLTDWSSDDSINVLVNAKTLVSMGKGTENKFTSTTTDQTVIAGFGAGKTIYGVNNKYNDKITTVVNGSQLKTTLDFTGQDGTLGNLNKYDLMYGKGDPTANITFNHKICVLRLDINSALLSTDGITSIKGLKLKYINSDLAKYPSLFASKIVYDFGATSDSTITDADSLDLNNINITLTSGKASVYIAIPDRQNLNGTLSLQLTGSNGTTSTAYDLTTPITLSNKSFKMSTVQSKTITSLSKSAKVGDYLFSDGTWGSLTSNHGTATPVAVVFSTTTSTTDQGHKWTHGYAMALKDASTDATWDPNDGKTFSNPSGTIITTVAAMKADKDGYTKTNMIINSSTNLGDNFPAAYAVKNYAVAVLGNTSGWYLPSVGQWYDIFVNLGKMGSGSYMEFNDLFYWDGQVSTCATNLNAYLTPLTSGTYSTFSPTKTTYWSSSEADYNAYCAAFLESGEVVIAGYPKTYSCIVRGVIAF